MPDGSDFEHPEAKRGKQPDQAVVLDKTGEPAPILNPKQNEEGEQQRTQNRGVNGTRVHARGISLKEASRETSKPQVNMEARAEQTLPLPRKGDVFVNPKTGERQVVEGIRKEGGQPVVMYSNEIRKGERAEGTKIHQKPPRNFEVQRKTGGFTERVSKNEADLNKTEWEYFTLFALCQDAFATLDELDGQELSDEAIKIVEEVGKATERVAQMREAWIALGDAGSEEVAKQKAQLLQQLKHEIAGLPAELVSPFPALKAVQREMKTKEQGNEQSNDGNGEKKKTGKSKRKVNVNGEKKDKKVSVVREGRLRKQKYRAGQGNGANGNNMELHRISGYDEDGNPMPKTEQPRRERQQGFDEAEQQLLARLRESVDSIASRLESGIQRAKTERTCRLLRPVAMVERDGQTQERLSDFLTPSHLELTDSLQAIDETGHRALSVSARQYIGQKNDTLIDLWRQKLQELKGKRESRGQEGKRKEGDLKKDVLPVTEPSPGAGEEQEKPPSENKIQQALTEFRRRAVSLMEKKAEDITKAESLRELWALGTPGSLALTGDEAGLQESLDTMKKDRDTELKAQAFLRRENPRRITAAWLLRNLQLAERAKGNEDQPKTSVEQSVDTKTFDALVDYFSKLPKPLLSKEKKEFEYLGVDEYRGGLVIKYRYGGVPAQTSPKQADTLLRWLQNNFDNFTLEPTGQSQPKEATENGTEMEHRADQEKPARDFEALEKTLPKVIWKQCASAVSEGLGPFVEHVRSAKGLTLQRVIESPRYGVEKIAQNLSPEIAQLLPSEWSEEERIAFALKFAIREIRDSME